VSGEALNIAFVHPDLGIGGAERLVVDAALQLQASGHRVTVFTTHHDPRRCFDASRMLDVRIHGDFLPLHIGQRLRAPCTIARMSYLAGALARRGDRYDVVVCDLLPHVVPLLRLLTGTKIVFYCHFPDRLLTPARHLLYRAYRAPIDRLEEIGLRTADRVLVNSRFTAACFRQTFPRLRLQPEVVYPGVDEAGASSTVDGEDSRSVILCISRFEPQKNLALAVDALAGLRQLLPGQTFSRLQLVIAGGYDAQRRESSATWRDLQSRIAACGLENSVRLMRSPTDAERLAWLARCLCVVYTPEHEHFGYVPLEAMAAGKPVIAVDSGGVAETVEHERTGLLCPPRSEAFAEALHRLILNPATAARLGHAGRAHVRARFSRAAFGARLESILRDVVA